MKCGKGLILNNVSSSLNKFKLLEVKLGIAIVIIAMGVGILLRNSISQFEDIRTSDVVGTYGTMYALITAFILVNAWNHFNEIKSTYAAETEALMHLWNFVDFLDDETM